MEHGLEEGYAESFVVGETHEGVGAGGVMAISSSWVTDPANSSRVGQTQFGGETLHGRWYSR